MVLDDAGLGRFATGLLSVAGAILAVSAAIWIFVFDRRARDEEDTFRRVQATAANLYEFLKSESDSPHNYLVNLSSYVSFAYVVSTLSAPHSVNDIPSYVDWRRNTGEISLKAQEVRSNITNAVQQAMADQSQPSISSELNEFHTNFVQLMNDIDLSIQDLDWVTGIRKSGAKRVETALGITIVVLLGSLLVGLASSIRTASGFADDWNLLWAAMLTTGVFGICFFILRAFRENSISRTDWIKKRERQARKKFGKNPPYG